MNKQEQELFDVPENLEEAIEAFKEMLPEIKRKEIASGQLNIISLHHGPGRWIRNNWGLWSGSKLQEFFHDLGIRHADDMSGIILESVQRDLRGEEINLDKQVKKYRDYWKDKGIDPDQIGKENSE